MGVVYRAEDTKLERQVAIEILPNILSGDPGRLASFEREAQMLAGQACFTGDSVTNVLAAVVKSEPDWAALPADTPWRVRDLREAELHIGLHVRSWKERILGE